MISRVNELQYKIKNISDGEYAVAKQDVDRLRQELGQPPLPSLQSTLEEKSAECVHPTSRSVPRITSLIASPPPHIHPAPDVSVPSYSYLKQLRLQAESANAATGTKRAGEDLGADGQPVKRPRGRPKGSKNSKPKTKPSSTPAPSGPPS